jgi:hypothetical protein
MSDIGRAIGFAARLYRERAVVGYAGYLRREPMARLQLRAGHTDPYPIYEQIRGRGTLVPTLMGNWVTASHRVCNSVLRNRRLGVRPEDGGAPSAADGVDLSFLEMNPPDHTRLRRLALPAFSPKVVASYRDRIERTVGGLLDRAASAGRFDLMPGFAAPLPIAVITDLLGVPDADSAEFARYGAAVGSALDGIKSLRHARALMANGLRLRRLFEELFELRRREPADDIISRLVAAGEDQIRPEEMLPVCGLLLVAGFETTVNLIGNSVLALLSHPAQWRDLCADPAGLAPRAVEETLRFDPPVQFTARIALEDMRIEDQPVRKGQTVMALVGGANRDPEVYDEPSRFDIHRQPAAEHLAFSSGIHYCLGQPLARLEATIALRMLAERMPGLSLAGPMRRRQTTLIRGPLRLPVAAGPARAARLVAGRAVA